MDYVMYTIIVRHLALPWFSHHHTHESCMMLRSSDGVHGFGEVIVSSNLRETKGYRPGFFFLRSKKKSWEK